MRIAIVDTDDAVRVWAAAAAVDGDRYPVELLARAVHKGDCFDLSSSDRRVTVAIVRGAIGCGELPRLPWQVLSRDGTEEVCGLLWRGSTCRVELLRLGAYDEAEDWEVTVEGLEAERAALGVLSELAVMRPYLALRYQAILRERAGYAGGRDAAPTD
jgi:hypothetical protein